MFVQILAHVVHNFLRDAFERGHKMKPQKSHKNQATTRLGAKGIATRSKDATRGSWPFY